MQEDGFDYEGVRSENLKEIIDTAMSFGMYGPPLNRLFFHAKQAQAEIDGDDRELVGVLEDELRATKRELKLINGQLTTTINNWEQAKGKLDRQKRELDERKRKLDERDARIAEEISAEQVAYWKERAEKAEELVETRRSKDGKILDLAGDIERVVRS